jgi:hypothetical protein
MNTRNIVACLTAAPLLMAASPAPVPVRLKPSSQWALDYAENSCRLIRTFGEGEDKTLLLFESPSPNSITMLAVGKPLGTSKNEVAARFRPLEHEPIKGEPATSTTNKQPAIHWLHVPLLPDNIVALEKALKEKATPGVRPPAIDLEERAATRAARQAFAEAAHELEIDTRRKRPVILETGSLGKPIKMFDECTRNSLRDWGVDPDLEDRIARPVWASDSARWFTSNDYPQAMVMRGMQSDVSARLLVDATGKVTSCTSLSHFNAPEFNKVVCEIFKKRAKFEPAELSDGTKVPSYYTVNIRFMMPV